MGVTNQWAQNQWAQNQWAQNQWAQNQWAQNQWAQNGWAGNSLANNPWALPMMTTEPLSNTYDSTIPPVDETQKGLRLQSVDPNAVFFMYYVTSCALRPDQSIVVNGTTLTGSIGLCPQWYGNPVEADTTCQEAVSACLISRNNAFGKRVNLSLHGEPKETFAVAMPAHPWSSHVASYAACVTGQPGYGLQKNCGWTGDYVGVCTPGTQVNVAAGAPAGGCNNAVQGTSSGDSMLRVCAGTEGCDFGGADYVTSNDDSQCSGYYLNPAATFTCPAIGYFTVMTSPYNSFGTPVTATAGVPGTSPGVLEYPASESWGAPQDNFDSYESPVASTVACTQTTTGPLRNCGWLTDYVGRCAPGASVSVGMGGSALGPQCGPKLGRQLSSGANVSTDGMLRVCNGIRACDAAAALAYDDDSCGTVSPYVTFTCPSSGTFSVMKAAYNSSYIVNGRVAVNSGGSNIYPGNENQVYNWQEGAFYGNMFAPGSMAPGVDIHVTGYTTCPGQTNFNPPGHQCGTVVNNSVDVTGSIYLKMYSCWSPQWTYGEAYLKNRICAGGSQGPQGFPSAPTQNCMATAVGACGTYYDTNYSQNNCGAQKGTSNDYQNCKGTNQDQYGTTPITTFLNDPCDLESNTGKNGPLCQTNPLP